MNLLDAVNLMLEAVGEHPVTSTSIRHPTVSKATTTLRNLRQQVLSQGYWFNTFQTTLSPDARGVIGIPENVLSFVPETGDTVAIRGDRLYNGTQLTFTFTAPVAGEIIWDMEFEELPITARIGIANRAAIQLYSVDIGIDQNISVYQENARLAMAQLDAEHVRQRRYSARNRTSWRRLQWARRT